MSSTDFPWEPPLAGSETEHLFGALDRLRTTFRWKADGLDEDGLRATIGASTLTIGSLLKHLAFVEAFYARLKLAGQSPGAPWETVDWGANPGWDFTSAVDDSPEELYALYDDAVARPARSTGPRWPTVAWTRSLMPMMTPAAMRVCAGWSSTSSRSTADTPGTPICSARPSTGGSEKTRRLAGGPSPAPTRSRGRELPRRCSDSARSAPTCLFACVMAMPQRATRIQP